MNASQFLAELPEVYPSSLLADIRMEMETLNMTIVVFDDDPTGTQTVYDIPVLTDPTFEAIRKEFDRKENLIYILTNTRSMSEQEACALNREVASKILQASEASGREFMIISRSDSTLRGHYPAEVDEIKDVLKEKEALTFLIPAFIEGGRYTIHDTHYVLEGDELIPAAETPFAKDKAFGFKHSNLKEYVEEKTKGKIGTKDVYSIGIQDVRNSDIKQLVDNFESIPDGSTCIVNAATYRDLEVFALGLIRSKRRFMIRSAASIIPVLAGLPPKKVMTSADYSDSGKGRVLVVVGSYVPKTTEQLKELLKEPGIEAIELNVNEILNDGEIDVKKMIDEVDRNLEEGKNVVVYTSRKLVASNDAQKSLQMGNVVSGFLTNLVNGLRVQPSCIMAKGGITSSDTATKGLKVKRAMVVGQAAPGVPVWRLGPESKFPGMDYIVFPGNVGDQHTLREVFQKVAASG